VPGAMRQRRQTNKRTDRQTDRQTNKEMDSIIALRRGLTSSSAVTKRPRDASCLSVVRFNCTKRRVESFITLQICHCVQLNAVLLSLA